MPPLLVPPLGRDSPRVRRRRATMEQPLGTRPRTFGVPVPSLSQHGNTCFHTSFRQARPTSAGFRQIFTVDQKGTTLAKPVPFCLVGKGALGKHTSHLMLWRAVWVSETRIAQSLGGSGSTLGALGATQEARARARRTGGGRCARGRQAGAGCARRALGVRGRRARTQAARRRCACPDRPPWTRCVCASFEGSASVTCSLLTPESGGSAHTEKVPDTMLVYHRPGTCA